LALTLAACAPLADQIDRTLNPTLQPRVARAGAEAEAAHARLMVVDTHADTLLWRRGIRRDEVKRGHVDLSRLMRGNIGFQVFAMPTRVPVKSGGCIKPGGLDPASILARINGWPEPTWTSPFRRALYQAERFNEAVGANPKTPRRSETEPHLWKIESPQDLAGWRAARFGGMHQDRGQIAVLLAMEGAHGLQDGDGRDWREALKALHGLGLRMVSPTHRFDNDFGGSSEGCGKGALTRPAGEDLINELIDRRMVIDVGHASGPTLMRIAEIARERGHPLLISHSGFGPYLQSLGADYDKDHRANTAEEVELVAWSGGAFGVGLWPAAIGAASVRNAVDAIIAVLDALRPLEGKMRDDGKFRIERASQHVALGSDWDGAVAAAIDAAQVAMITEGLRNSHRVSEQEIADIMGRSACRVIAQSLSGSSRDQRKAFQTAFNEAVALCDGKGLPAR